MSSDVGKEHGFYPLGKVICGYENLWPFVEVRRMVSIKSQPHNENGQRGSMVMKS